MATEHFCPSLAQPCDQNITIQRQSTVSAPLDKTAMSLNNAKNPGGGGGEGTQQSFAEGGSTTQSSNP